MYNLLKKIASIAIVVLVLFFTVISILAIWDVIIIENILSKSLGTLLVLFVSSAIILFIFSVILRDDKK